MAELIDTTNRGMTKAKIMTNSFMLGWRIARLNVIDKSNNRIFLISEPYWHNGNSDMPGTAKRRLYDVYMEYRSI
jgi:hypothetical protein